MTSSNFNSEQSEAIRALDTALADFNEADLFASSENLAEKRDSVISAVVDLKLLFPKIAKIANEYYYSDDPQEPTHLEGYGDALFSLFVDLESFEKSNCLNDFTRLENQLGDSLSDTRSFSPEWDWERGVWKSEDAILLDQAHIRLAEDGRIPLSDLISELGLEDKTD
jgi:hypothetical protein